MFAWSVACTTSLCMRVCCNIFPLPPISCWLAWIWPDNPEKSDLCVSIFLLLQSAKKTCAGKTSFCQLLEAIFFLCLKPCLDPCSGLDWQPRTCKLNSEFSLKKPSRGIKPSRGKKPSRGIKPSRGKKPSRGPKPSRGKKPLEGKNSTLWFWLSFWKWKNCNSLIPVERTTNPPYTHSRSGLKVLRSGTTARGGGNAAEG